MAFKIFLQIFIAVLISPIYARIVSPDHPGTILSQGNNNAISSHPQYSYGYNVNDALTGDSKVHNEVRNGDAVRGSYSFVESDGSRRVVHYTADGVNGFNALVQKQTSVHNGVHQSHIPIGQSQAYPELDSSEIKNLPLAPSVYPNHVHTIAHSASHQIQPAIQVHNPAVSVPTAPAIIRHPQGGHQLQEPKIGIPSASAIIRPVTPVLPKSHMQSAIVPYSQTVGNYQQSHSTPVSQVPVFVVQPFTWYGKSQHSSFPINPNNKQHGMLPIVRVPTATVRPPAPAYGKIPSNHPNAIQDEEQVPYLNQPGIRPIILGRYGYALTNAPFKLKHN